MKLTARLLPLVAPFMAQGDIRYYLNGINVRPHPEGGALIAACDGHTLGVIYDRDAEGVETDMVLKIDKRTIAACAVYKYCQNRFLSLKNDRLTVEANGVEEHIQAGNPIIDGKFPDYQNVIPDSQKLKPGLLGCFNNEYVARLHLVAKQARKLGFGKWLGVEFFNSEDKREGAAVARIQGIDDFLSVIMPLCRDNVEIAVPSWMAIIPKTESKQSGSHQ